MNVVLARIRDEMKPQSASTAAGKRAKRAALTETDGWIGANRLEMRGLRAWLAGHHAKARRLGRRADRMMRRVTYPAGKRAANAFAAAGFKTKPLSA